MVLCTHKNTLGTATTPGFGQVCVETSSFHVPDRLHVTDKAFFVVGQQAWNALPSDIKLTSSRTSFRKKLKTLVQTDVANS